MLYRKPIKHQYTTETRISRSDTKAMEYLSELLALYGAEKRYALHHMEKGKSDSKLNTEMQKRFHVSKRSANSAIRDVKGCVESVKELREYNSKQLKLKISSVEKKIRGFEKAVDKMKPLAKDNRLNGEKLAQYRNAKQNLFQQQQKLNRLRQKLAVLEKRTDTDICFGTKKMFRQQLNLEENGLRSHEEWQERFRGKRDSCAEFLGSADEPCGNQNCQLSHDGEAGTYTLRIRKEYCLGGDGKAKPSDDGQWLEIKGLRFKYMEKGLRAVTAAHAKGGTGIKEPVTVRILRRGRNRWYVQVMLSTKIRSGTEWQSGAFNGVLGADFNEGFVEVAETDRYGNLCGGWHYDLSEHTGSGQSLEAMRKFADWFTQLALSKHKDIVIEDLNFTNAKGKTVPAYSRSGKKYNRMLHMLDYSRYKACLENACGRKNLLLRKVDPAYTSKIGKQKFAGRMKLTVHRAAAYVIARKSQGFRDRLVKETRPDKTTAKPAADSAA